MAIVVTKTITYDEAMNPHVCPMCGSKNVSIVLQHERNRWSAPHCNDCGYGGGPAGANSGDGIWVSWNIPHDVDTFEISYWNRTDIPPLLKTLIEQAGIDLLDIENEYENHFRDKLITFAKLIIGQCGIETDDKYTERFLGVFELDKE